RRVHGLEGGALVPHPTGVEGVLGACEETGEPVGAVREGECTRGVAEQGSHTGNAAELEVDLLDRGSELREVRGIRARPVGPWREAAEDVVERGDEIGRLGRNASRAPPDDADDPAHAPNTPETRRRPGEE